MKFSTLKFTEPEAGIGLLKFNRPNRLNALTREMLEELEVFYDQVNKNEKIRVLIIMGEGRGFCSGVDLKDRSKTTAPLYKNAAGHLMVSQKKYAEIIYKMRRVPQPIIAAVNGPAAGAGMSFALASDVIYAGPEAKFIASFINIGLTPGELGTTYFLPKLVGSTRAAEILMTGRTVDTMEADKIGLVCRVTEAEALMGTAMETARQMLGKTPLGLRLTKEALNLNSTTPSLEAAIELENRNQSLLVFTPEFEKAVQSFAK